MRSSFYNEVTINCIKFFKLFFSRMTTSTNGNGNLIDEFEEAFQQCLNLFTKDDGLENNSIGLTVDKDETKIEVDQITFRCIDLARQVEAFFLQKRFLLSALKPELVVKEDITDLKVELLRKEELIKRHYEKILIWQNLLAEMHGWVQPNGFTHSTQSIQNQGINNSNNSTVQQQILQHQHIQQQQQQMHLQQHQIQQLHQQQAQQTSGSSSINLQGTGVSVGAQSIFLNQGNVSTSRSSTFPVASVNSSSLQGPLAFLEKTTSNIGMPERRS
ncbi:PREDICTED: mediator of RNA polymerase II transcription subunit 28 isoform X2 [Ceratosolen solmsi marchali]|uniref:Mediator of RNA polymerase II transcription subunit 28 n=1 Tax=Ceratosolen solmsi marchali TaxID=326594 RepID=A0AAJ7E2G2_9HYME|nr:PREDICTED: mediator of RNA polymerase II transcription subunit 28 isoform X2 [Ceratosolen solmsi marchali]